MTKLPLRLVAAGLGTLSLSGCLVIPPEAMSDHGPGPSPTATPLQAGSTVRRVAPPPATMAMANPNTPVQYIAVPADQLVYDASGRAQVKADAIPPGFMPVMLPANATPPMMAQSPSPNPAMMPALAQNPPMQPMMPAITPVEVVVISHTDEPPMATSDPAKRQAAAPRQLPDAVNRMTAMPQVSNKTEPLPMIINGKPAAKAMTQEQAAAGSQLLVFQQPQGYNTIQYGKKTPTADGMPNMLIPPVAPEELKLVAAPRANAATGPVSAALKAYQDRQPDDAEKQLSQVDPANRDVLRKMLPLAARLGESGSACADASEVAELVDQLQNVVGTLRAKAALRIEKLTYCRTPTKPVRLGAYQPLDDDNIFRVGDTVELYMELRNFSCQAKDKEFHTHLTTAIEVRDDRNEVIARYDFERDRPDVGQAPKHEYFHICRFPVQNMMAGQYTLCAIVTDVPTGKSATRMLPLRVEAARRVARGSAE